MTHGSAGQVRLDGAAGSVYAFTAGVDDLLTYRASLADLLNSLTPESRSLMNPTPAAFDPNGISRLSRP